MQDYLKAMREVYLKGLYSYYFFEAISELLALNICGEDIAKENMEVMSRYDGFWEATRMAHYFHCIVQFAKCFDESPTSISLYLIRTHSWKNLSKLTKEAFKDFNKDRKFLDEMVKNYRGIDEQDFKEMRALLKKCQKSIDRLVEYRHHFCHALLEPQKPNFTIGEIHDLANMIGNILNIFTKQTNHETTWYDRVEEDAKNSVRTIIDELKRFEPYRLKEIEEKYGSLRSHEP